MKHNLEIIFTFFLGILFGLAIFGTVQAHTETPERETSDLIKTQYVYIETEKVVEVPVEVEAPVYVEEDFFRNYSEADSWYFKDYAMREGESEGVVGMLWLMYTFENRCEAFGTTPAEEWASPASKSSMSRTGIEPNEDCLKAYELFVEGWTPRPLYFRTGNYHDFGTPLAKVGAHYFSSK